MKFTPLPLKDAFLIELEAFTDHRGSFARTFCTKEFATHGLVTQFVQCSTSQNITKGLIRGMHFQVAPYEETKLVRCTRGSIFDVIIDVRNESDTFNQWYGVELTSTNSKMLYIPKGFAHGYQVLEEDSEVFYMMDEFYQKETAREIEPFSILPRDFFPL